MDIKVSIIIPVYNVAPYLDACLSSCVNQTFREIEIIVVNDGSTDESPLIIQKYAEKDDRIKVITKENEGLIYARKSGLDVAHGEYISHLDGDDYMEINMIEKLYNEALKEEADYVVANFYEVNDKRRHEVWRSDGIRGLSGEDFFLGILQGRFEVWGRLIRKSLYDGVIYKPVVMGEDLFMAMQILPKVKKPVVIDDFLYNYVVRANSITRQNEEIVRKHNLYMIRSVFSLLDVYPYSQPIKERVYLMFYIILLKCMSQKRVEIRTVLYDCYWSKKDVRTFLWRKRKDFYLILNIFFRSPFLARLVAREYLYIIPLWIKYLRSNKQ